ncbi:efflux RND transporter periplasmic adaptor subunit [Fodinibius sediminis]|uniref:Membrane fusion protein, cobalt-zinc-cadmium efflux system n=1 Tax=Fodinibius sediminis TaxID=1214077 RepID=A0A521BK39_9BACT|nr:efflux RND transporter periplasmic adaptor subunit [Fodinibius sediminis]SMO47469.1 membrane fusion protein, cobalt-zinc-cadmium efflux system [Fodinibius sediminis]
MTLLSTYILRPAARWNLLLLMTGLLLSSCGGDSVDGDAAVDPGTPPSVTASTATKTVHLSEQQARDLNIQTLTIEPQQVSFTIQSPGQVFAAPQHMSLVSAPINGRVATIYAHEGEQITKGAPLVELESLEFANLVADYLEVTAEVTYQQQQVERLKVLTEERISPERTLQRAQADLQMALTKQNASHARLHAIGISDRAIEQWDPQTSEPQSRLTIHAPITGTINEHMIELGQSVNAYEEMLSIIDNKEVLVRGFVSASDAPFLQRGNSVIITERAGDDVSSGARIEATVTSINPALDKTNKSIVLNSIVATQNGWPIIGQNVRMTYTARAEEGTISIPMTAIQFDESDATVFVERSPLEYEKRPVGIKRATAEYAIIESGLQPGDKIAVTQVFSLKALERFEQFAD